MAGRVQRNRAQQVSLGMYDDKERLLSEITQEGIFATIYLGSTKIGRIKISGASTEIPETTWYHNDVLGTPVKMSFAAADGTQVNNSYYLDPWGNYERTLESTNNVQTVQYTGKQLDEEAYLFYFNARYYDPALGRFVGEDKVGYSAMQPKTLNRFCYVLNNSINNFDPDGNIPYDQLVTNYTHLSDNFLENRGSKWVYPKNEYISSTTYVKGWTEVPRLHAGTDISAEKDTPFKSAADGKVVFNGIYPGYGNLTVIESIYEGKNVYALYGHQAELNKDLTVGTAVKENQTIGEVGGTYAGRDYKLTEDYFPSHLHFEIRTNLDKNGNETDWEHGQIDSVNLNPQRVDLQTEE